MGGQALIIQPLCNGNDLRELCRPVWATSLQVLIRQQFALSKNECGTDILSGRTDPLLGPSVGFCPSV